MSKVKQTPRTPHGNIAFFIPHLGCRHMCSFCAQRTITGQASAVGIDDVEMVCSEQLKTAKNPENIQVAFFGGSFTAIDRDYMTRLLKAVQPFLGEGKFSGIRISTRPDAIDKEVLEILKENKVTSIELGAQSLDNEVLTANLRGHTAEDVFRASELIKSEGFELGLQMMTGLYKSTPGKDLKTAEKIVEIAPETLRIYPTAVLPNTLLAKLMSEGEYIPLTLEQTVDLCADIYSLVTSNGIDVIRMGLHSEQGVQENAVGGCVHPAFAELVRGTLFRRALEKFLRGSDNAERRIAVKVSPCDVSVAVGHKRCNKEYFADLGFEIKVLADERIDKSSAEAFGKKFDF